MASFDDRPLPVTVTSISRVAFLLALVLLMPIGARADDDDDTPSNQAMPTAKSLADDAAGRFPQPVRVGDLLGREVLEPVVSRHRLGRVDTLVHGKDGLEVVVDYGGWFGFHARPIAVPVDAMTLLGRSMEIVGFTPEQLNDFPTFDPAGTSPVAADTIVKIGLSKPSH